MRPAAVAEININGTNIHSTFIIPVVKDQNKIFFLLEIEKEERWIEVDYDRWNFNSFKRSAFLKFI